MRALTLPVIRALLGSALESLAGGASGGSGGRGPELLTNGSFNAGATGWTVTGADATHIATFDGATLRYQSDTTSPQLNVVQNGVATVGKVYEATIVVSAYTSGTLKTDVMAGATSINAAGTFTYRGVATSANFNLSRVTANVDMTVDSVSLRPITA